MKKIKQFLLKKDEASGNVFGMICILLSLIVCALLITLFMNYTKVITVKEEADLISRKYLLKMETVGYLTPSDQELLRTSLTEIGVTNISFIGTTLTRVSYGSDISLSITGKISTGLLESNELSLTESEKPTFSIRKTSTAKYREP